MKTSLIAVALVSAVLAGCASAPEATQVAAADCKVQPLQVATISGGKRRPVSDIDRTKAVADFAHFEASVSRANLSPRHGMLYEDILRDCNR